MVISFFAEPFNEKSGDENADYADDAPNQKLPNAPEMAVRGIAGAPAPSPLRVKRDAAGHEAPNEYDER